METKTLYDFASPPIFPSFWQGTTGRPKGVTMNHHALVNNAFLIGQFMNYSEVRLDTMLSALNWELARTNTVFASRVYVKNECLSYCLFLTTVPLLRQLVVFFLKDIFSWFPLASYIFPPLTRGSLISMAQITRFPAFSSHRLPVHPRNSITMLFLTFCARHSIIC